MSPDAAAAAVATCSGLSRCWRRESPRVCRSLASRAPSPTGAVVGQSARLRRPTHPAADDVADWCDVVARSLRSGSSLTRRRRCRGGNGVADVSRSWHRWSAGSVAATRSSTPSIEPASTRRLRPVWPSPCCARVPGSAARRRHRSNEPRRHCVPVTQSPPSNMPRAPRRDFRPGPHARADRSAWCCCPRRSQGSLGHHHPGGDRRRDTRWPAQRRRCAVDAPHHRTSEMSARRGVGRCRRRCGTRRRRGRGLGGGSGASSPAAMRPCPTVHRPAACQPASRRCRPAVAAVAAVATAGPGLAVVASVCLGRPSSPTVATRRALPGRRSRRRCRMPSS